MTHPRLTDTELEKLARGECISGSHMRDLARTAAELIAARKRLPPPLPPQVTGEQRATLEEIERFRVKAADWISAHIPKGWGFCLLLANYGPGHSFTSYISSVDRPGAAQMMKELIFKWARAEPHV